MVKVKVKLLSHVPLFVTPWTEAYHAPPSMGFSRQEYWSGLPFPSPEDLPNPGTDVGLPHCRQTLNHLSHHGILPKVMLTIKIIVKFCKPQINKQEMFAL